jgi:hypothetical protein
MNWKSRVLVFLLNTALVFGAHIWLFGLRFDSHDWWVNALAVIAISLAWFGNKELIRGGQRQAKRTLAVCIVILFLPLVTRTVRGNDAWPLVYAILALAAASYPLALFLNRRQNEPSSQQTIDNAS